MNSIEFHGEMIYFTNIKEALECAYRKGKLESYNEGFDDGREFARKIMKMNKKSKTK